ncbi:MAG TPA: hypothetical protein VMG58_13335 [Candidatus Sulfotelmatobacter sp.]|nr:hypothetical protein [Candidatus Sulfotelmatobacter sp.]
MPADRAERRPGERSQPPDEGAVPPAAEEGSHRPTAAIQLLHAIPGRIRLRLPALHGNPALAEQLRGGLGLVPGILAAEASPFTGSLLIVYDPGRYSSPADLLALGQAMPGLLDGTDVDALVQQAEAGTSDAGSLDLAAVVAPLNAWVASATSGVDLKLLVPLGLFALGLRGLLLSERTLPAWYDFFWFAFGTYMMLNRDASRPEASAGVVAVDVSERAGTP